MIIEESKILKEKKCEHLKGVRCKYIQEVTGDENAILDKNFSICQLCKAKLQ